MKADLKVYPKMTIVALALQSSTWRSNRANLSPHSRQLKVKSRSKILLRLCVN
jgi:hypothetical protein